MWLLALPVWLAALVLVLILAGVADARAPPHVRIAGAACVVLSSSGWKDHQLPLGPDGQANLGARLRVRRQHDEVDDRGSVPTAWTICSPAK